jgi:4,5-dihydroxyphthalate decarboxylase
MNPAIDQPITAVIGAQKWRDALRRASAQADAIVRLDWIEVSSINRTFAPMAREQKFDLSEMAIVTALQALAYGKPLLLLPVTVTARFPHRCLITRRASAPLHPQDLAGRRIGVRGYTLTTGVWLRGILQNEYGVAVDSVRWVTQEGAHVAEYQDPPWVERGPAGTKLPELLRTGEVDAIIMGNDLPDDPEFVPVIADPDAAAQDWFKKHGVDPINHMLMVKRERFDADPGALRKLWNLIEICKPEGSVIGIEAHRRVLELLLGYCDQQKLLPRRLGLDEIFAPTTALMDKI